MEKKKKSRSPSTQEEAYTAGRGLQKDNRQFRPFALLTESVQKDTALQQLEPHQAPLFFSFSISWVFLSKSGDLSWSQKDRSELADSQR